MPELTIQLRTNPVTGRKDVIVHMTSDEEALPHEHERQHRVLVEQLLGLGVVDEEQLGEIIVERVQPERTPSADEESSDTAPNRESQSDGA